MLSLVWRESAIEEQEQVFEYISGEDVAAAIRLRQAIADCAERLPAFPYMYRKGRIAGTREAVIHPNYLLVYRVGTDFVEVLRIVHARQQYP